MGKINNVLDSILSEIELDKETLKKVENSSKEILKELAKKGFKAKIGGSLAKSTMIKKNRQDVDIFLEFKDKKDLEKNYPKVTKIFQDGEFLHGSRDYFVLQREEIIFELIPVIKFDKPEFVDNVTDFSLIHVEYIKKKIAKNRKLANEIKLAKAFCHAQNVYGAESYIGGFSGYGLEVLICYYGSFENLLKKISKENIIDPEKKFKNKNEILREINKSKLNSPIILIDPTYRYRNACAGLTQETFDKFIVAVKSFLKNPSTDFFIKKEFDLDNFIKDSKEKDLEIYQIEFSTERQEGDIAGTKMKKAFKFLIDQLKRKQQETIFSEFVYQEGQTAKGYLAIKVTPEIEIIGPKAEMKKAVSEFKKVRKNIYESKGFFCAKEIVKLEDLFEKQTETVKGMQVDFTYKKLD